MKANLQPQSGTGLRAVLRRRHSAPMVEQIIESLTALAAGFFLAGFQLADTVLPLPICLSAALGLCAASFGAYVGGCLGYLIFYPFHALELMAVGLLVQAALCIFGEDLPDYDRWFAVAAAAAFTALVGFLFLLEQRFAPDRLWRYFLRVAAAAGGALCFRVALQESRSVCRLILLACLCGGGCAVRPVGLPLGAVAACILAAAAVHTSAGPLTAALCGLAVDLAWAPGGATGVFLLAALLSCTGNRVLRTCIWLVSMVPGVAFLKTDPLLLAAAVIAAPCSLLVPAERVFPPRNPRPDGEDPRLLSAAGLLRQLHMGMDTTRRESPDPETAAVFDQAAERVCRVCGGWDRCWKEQVSCTVEELERAAPAMMARGYALRRDLPVSFVERCSHVDGFLKAVNRGLDDLSCRRQCRSRVREARQILMQQYQVLSDALAQPPMQQQFSCRFRPEVGFRSEEAPRQPVSGDRAVTFRVGKYFYLILCDGMGTGSEAEHEAAAAIGVLRTLLQAQVSPEDAMELLNGIYVLRDDGVFATVDLVCADLMTGDTKLLKWGSAPSYLKRKNHVEKLGASSMPPGIGVGEDYRPEQLQLSLARGEMLVLLSDGAATESTERFLRQYAGSFPGEVACGVIHAQSKPEDDTTAAVLMLRAKLPK